MPPGVIDYTQIVRYLEIFLKLPHHQRTREDLLDQLLATPPQWLTERLTSDQELSPSHVKQVENDQRLFEMTKCVQAIAESMLTVARSRCSELHCSMVHPNSSTAYPYQKDAVQPIRLVRLSLDAVNIGPWRGQLGLRSITLQAGVTTGEAKQPIGLLGLMFQKDKRLTVSLIDLDGHLKTTDLAPYTITERLTDFSLGVTAARSVFGLRQLPHIPPTPGTPLDPVLDPKWLAERLPELANILDRIAGK